MASNVIDKPAEANEDRLDMKAYAEALTKFIKDAQAPLTIALQGEWGSGKTSLMNALKKNLVDDVNAPYFGVWVNTWQFALMSDSEEAIIKILLGMIGQITSASQTAENTKTSLLKKVWSVGRSVASQVIAKQTGVDFEKTLADMQNESSDGKSGVQSLKEELSGIIQASLKNNSGKHGYLFFIDDLDRIDPPVAVQILELLKNIFDLENCIFVLAIDYGVVVKGLKPKFGAMTPENEREFRSFFDKIIQLPFSMPVGRYKIDDFLTESLVSIGFLNDTERNNEDMKRVLTSYALESVGTNPRSLKRLINYLSLIRLLIEQTETKEDDSDFKDWKDVLFALVCLQIQYPKIYDALVDEPDFPAWGEAFEQKMRLPKLEAEEVAKLNEMEEFDEAWEKMLFRFCRRDTFLEARAINISRTLNRVKSRIVDSNQPVGEIVQWLMRLSAVTSVKNEPEKAQEAVNFNKSEYLKALRRHALKMREVTFKKDRLWDAGLPGGSCIYSWQKRVQTNLECRIWLNRKSVKEECGDYITSPIFHIFHDGKSFQLKMWGEFWGAWPKEQYKGIDFTADAIQADLAKAEAAIGKAFNVFGKTVNCGHNPQDIWWNVTIPIASHDELVSEAFSQNLCGSLARLAGAFTGLLGYRIQTNNTEK